MTLAEALVPELNRLACPAQDWQPVVRAVRSARAENQGGALVVSFPDGSRAEYLVAEQRWVAGVYQWVIDVAEALATP